MDAMALSRLVQKARRYFAKGATDEILAQFRPSLAPHDTQFFNSVVSALTVLNLCGLLRAESAALDFCGCAQLLLWYCCRRC